MIEMSRKIPWLPAFPEDWPCEKLKYHLKRTSIRGKTDAEVLSLYRDHGVVIKSSRDDNHNRTSEDKSKYLYVKKGDLVINKMKAWQGSVGVSNHEGIVSPAYYVYEFTSNRLNSEYLHVLLRTFYWQEFARLSAGIRTGQWDLSAYDFENVLIPVPPIEIQQKIANKINESNTKIHCVLHKYELELKKLYQFREALITRAVTKGLDPNVPMKETEFQWIGKIPSHWKVAKVGALYKLSNGLSKGSEFFGSGYPFVRYGDVYNNIFIPNKPEGLVNSSEKDRASCSVRRGDVFFTRTSETIEELGFSSVALEDIENATFAGFLIRARPVLNVLSPEFSGYYFRAKSNRFFFIRETNLVTRASLSQPLLNKLPVLIPPEPEQEAIYKYCRSVDERVESLTEKISKQIHLMNEYKSALISKMIEGAV